jgi:hypothetical protein
MSGKSSIIRLAVERLLTQLESGQLELPLGIYEMSETRSRKNKTAPPAPRLSFSGHETFVFRHSWLKKGVDAISADPVLRVLQSQQHLASDLVSMIPPNDASLGRIAATRHVRSSCIECRWLK